MFTFIARSLLALVVALCAAWQWGPRESTQLDPALALITLPAAPAALDDWLAGQEVRFNDITPGAQKQIVWADPVARAATDWALLYLHGFSATAQETRPLADRLGAALGANVFYTRLRGHGRSGAALAEARYADWQRDLAEALAVGRVLGRRLLVIGTSTGASLAAVAAADPALATGVAGWVLISPNFKVRADGAFLLDAPWARQLVPLIAGAERRWEPHNAAHARYWTSAYPSAALVSMATAVRAANAARVEAAGAPALFLFSEADRVVDHRRSRAIARRWGGGAEVAVIEPASGDDPDRHVIAGDILSPGSTGAVAARILAWLGTLPAPALP